MVAGLIEPAAVLPTALRPVMSFCVNLAFGALRQNAAQIPTYDRRPPPWCKPRLSRDSKTAGGSSRISRKLSRERAAADAAFLIRRQNEDLWSLTGAWTMTLARGPRPQDASTMRFGTARGKTDPREVIRDKGSRRCPTGYGRDGSCGPNDAPGRVGRNIFR